MSWTALLEIIAAEAGADTARSIEQRARRELGGLRIYITTRETVSADALEAVSPGRPRTAAKKLGIHPATAYRALRKAVLVR